MMKTLGALCCAAWLALLYGAPMPAQAGKPKDLICDKVVEGSFWESMDDNCYQCPKGFRHDPGASVNTGACMRTDNREGEYQRRDGKKQPGPVCTEGAWVSMHDLKDWPLGVCMKCPKPPADKYRGGERVRWSPGDGRYDHDHRKKGDEDGVCTRPVFAAADLVAVNVVGGKLLRLCEATLTVFAPKKKAPTLLKLPPAELPRGVATKELVAAVEKFKAGLSGGEREVLTKLTKLAAKLDKAKLETLLLDPGTLCNSSSVLKKLDDMGLVPPGWSKKHFVAFSLSFDAGLGAGVQGGYMLVTNFDEVVFTVGVLGTQLGAKASAGAAGGLQFFPDVDSVEDFFGPGLGASVGVDLFGAGLGVDASFTFKNGKVALQGIGPSLGLGVGPLPGSAVVTGTYSWDMAKVKNY